MTTPPAPLPATPTPFPVFGWQCDPLDQSGRVQLTVDGVPFAEVQTLKTAETTIAALRKSFDLERECAALRESKWQPIESAPKDGTEIIVWREDAGVFTAAFKDSFQEGDAWNDPTGDPCWFTASGEDLTGDLPVLWQPLPEPPAARRALGKEGE